MKRSLGSQFWRLEVPVCGSGFWWVSAEALCCSGMWRRTDITGWDRAPPLLVKPLSPPRSPIPMITLILISPALPLQTLLTQEFEYYIPKG